MAIYYWVGGAGSWNNTTTTNWAIVSGGAGGNGPPNAADTANFDANSGSGTVSVAATAVSLSTTLNNANIVLSLTGNPTLCTSAGTFTFTQGTITLGSNTLTVGRFITINSNVRTINFDTGDITLTANANTVYSSATATNLTTTGSRVINCSYSGSTGTRTVNCGALSETNSLNINVTAGTDIFAVDAASGGIKNLSFTGFSGTFTQNSMNMFGDLTLSTGMSLASSTGRIGFFTTSTSNIISNGKTFDCPILINGSGGTVVLQDNFTIASTRTLTLTNGTFNANNNQVSIGNFALGAGTKTLSIGSGTWALTGTSWNANTNVTGLTVSASVGTINMTNASSKIFAGGAKTWPTLNQGGAGALTIQQSNTFTNITNTVQPATITLTSGTTQTVTDFDVSGTSGNLITLNASTPGSRATLTDSGGVNSVSYVDIKDIAATGYGEWQAYTSNGNVDSGNNVGWVFLAPPPLTASEYQISFRSFTERRSF